MINFTKIHGFESGQSHSFEELVCQVARKEPFPEGSEFRRVEGSGGDGGVEAYWIKTGGKKTGFQAKYFLRCGNIKWQQIDNSVKQALQHHPELERYVVALPCDLTDKSGNKGRGKSGWEQWNQHIQKWREEAAELEIQNIDFVPWPKSELLGRLANPGMEGLKEHFFGAVEINDAWIQDKFRQAVLALDERFNPEDHVGVSIENLFPAITRGEPIRKELSDALVAIQRCSLPDSRIERLSKHPDPQHFDELQECIKKLLEIEEQFNLEPQHKWNIADWSTRAKNVLAANDSIREWFWDHDNSLKKNSHEGYVIRTLIEKCGKLASAIDDFRGLVCSPIMEAEQSRAAFIHGVAGSGKSHVLAKAASDAIKLGQPAILLLGQHFNDSELWSQISHFLGVPGLTSDGILGVLDAIGQKSNCRTLLLVDAINEGPGSQYWRNHLANLISNVKKYSHVCCVLACRTEYFDVAVPESIREDSVVFCIRGFESLEEQTNAAKVYLDRRGIARPSTPWLSPEFVNPLFFRTVCTSLERDGKSELPAGLTGTRDILRYYLDSIGGAITLSEDSSVPLAPKIEQAVVGFATQILERRQDFLEVDLCRDELASHFFHIHPKSASDWLSVFLNNGLLRKDPHPSREAGQRGEEVIRFSFQRFQDYLMAEQALSSVPEGTDLFGQQGALAFCLDKDKLDWRWHGLVDALSVAMPELIQMELVDSLPGRTEHWWRVHGVQQSFAESVKWRARSAFTARTLELLNKLDRASAGPYALLLQVSVSAEHPWNAEFLHENLVRRTLADRDASWTTWVNFQDRYEDSTIDILIEWCNCGQVPQTHPKNQYLAALVLCWFLSSTNRSIRDRSTKALTSLLTVNKGIFPELLDQFCNTDDLYVLERLLAAAYGACCISPQPTRLTEYSEAIFGHVFREGAPPHGIRLRDYALGVLELANHIGALPREIDLDNCRPPYNSPRVRFSVTEEKLEAIGKEAGDDTIIRSCTSSMYDFSQYEIEPRVSRFSRVLLTREAPFTREDRARRFEKEVIGGDAPRMQALNRLQHTANPYTYGIKSFSLESGPSEPSQDQLKKWLEDRKDAEKELVNLLGSGEQERFKSEFVPFLNERSERREEISRIDLDASKRWIAKRAYDFGWMSKRFQHERSLGGHHTRDRPSIERISKKYQWLALDELLSRLADNYWMAGEYGEPPKSYSGPIDLGFYRDIDPTIVLGHFTKPNLDLEDHSWAFAPPTKFEDIPEVELSDWPFRENPAQNVRSLPLRTDDEGVKWFVLYENQSETERYPEGFPSEHGTRIQEFRILETVMVSIEEVEQIVEMYKQKKKVDLVDSGVLESTDAAFLHEAPWRSTWSQEKWQFDDFRLPTGVAYAPLVARYCWEHHLDASLPDGLTTYLPSPWLSRQLSFQPDKSLTGVWRDDSEEVVFRDIRGKDRSTVCLLRADKLNEVLGADYTTLSVMVSERNAWPGGNNQLAAWRRSEAVCWKESDKFRAIDWHRDYKNGKQSD